MRRFCVITLLAMLGLTAASRPANAIGAMASWWNMNDANEDGFGVGLRQKIPILPILALDTRASWLRFSDSDLDAFPLEVTGIASVGLLYAGLGFGYYILDAEHFDVENNFGWYVVGGVQIGAGAAGIFGEVKWTSLSADVDDVDPNISDIPNSIDADGVGFNIGVMFGL